MEILDGIEASEVLHVYLYRQPFEGVSREQPWSAVRYDVRTLGQDISFIHATLAICTSKKTVLPRLVGGSIIKPERACLVNDLKWAIHIFKMPAAILDPAAVWAT
ncbi:MAG: hypothetical protein M1493_03370 [Firmicutes bacterium]|nr:hypothetical protein [Bacillota bacterium]